MNNKTTIEIKSMDRTRSFIENIKGIIYVNRMGSINFEIFRPPHARYKMHLRVYNKTKTVFIENFKEFISSDFDNRKIILWLAKNAEKLISIEGPK